MSIDSPQVTEGDAGTTDLVFTVTLSAASGVVISVNFATAEGTATLPADFKPTSGSLSFAPGETSKTIFVQVRGELIDEPNEHFTATLTNPTNASLGEAVGTGTIFDNDPPPVILIDEPFVVEGDAGTTQFTFNVSLSAASSQPITVAFTMNAATASSPDDFAATSGILTFAPGEINKPITVDVVGDLLDEPHGLGLHFCL